MKSNSVGWFKIYVQDIPRAKAFYEAVFQDGLKKLGLDSNFRLQNQVRMKLEFL
jgi:predicted enzyme related to lactoylglutathione lyase